MDQRDDYADGPEPVRQPWSNEMAFFAAVLAFVVMVAATVVALRVLVG